MARDRRPRDDDDDDDDDRPRRRRRPAEDEEEDEAPRPKKKPRVVDEDDEDEPPRRVKPRVVDEDEDDDEEEERPRRRKKKKPAGMSKGLLFGLIGGGVALVGGVVLLIVLLSGGGSPKTVVEKTMRAVKNGDFATMYDNMSETVQKRMADTMRLATTFDPALRQYQSLSDRDLFIQMCKDKEAKSGNPFKMQSEATVISETITGNTASVRVKNPNGRDETIQLIKENGRWKLNGL